MKGALLHLHIFCILVLGFGNHGGHCTRPEGIMTATLPLVQFAGRNISVREVLYKDRLRFVHLQMIASGGSSRKNGSLLRDTKPSVPLKDGTYLDTLNFVVTIGLGTPRVAQTLVVDTGSGINWVQCEPCSVACYDQAEPIFDPSLSSTYRALSCSSTACNDLSETDCDGDECTYGIEYGDGSTTSGPLSSDTLTFTPTAVFRNFIFGCGQNNRGIFDGEAGLLGLSRAPYSLGAQLASRFGKIFSYCIPSSASSSGFLNFGPPLRPRPMYTPLVTRPDDDSQFYYVDLIGISVGGIPLPIDVDVFRGPGIILDSGSVVTRFPPDAYSALREAFRSGMSQYQLTEPEVDFDTCYNFRNFNNIRYPAIELRFTGGWIRLPKQGIFYIVDATQICLAFAATKEETEGGVIGNIQQKTFEIIHDNGANRIGFAANACR